MVGGREFTAFMTAIGNGSILISGGYLPSIIMYGYMFGMGGMWFYLGWGHRSSGGLAVLGRLLADIRRPDAHRVV